MKSFFSKQRIAVVAAILLALFVIRPGASRLKSRIIRSISAAVGRAVDIGSVHIRLLPRPGFDLENLVVYDDPAFGAEPIVRAERGHRRPAIDRPVAWAHGDLAPRPD